MSQWRIRKDLALISIWPRAQPFITIEGMALIDVQGPGSRSRSAPNRHQAAVVAAGAALRCSRFMDLNGTSFVQP